MLPFPPPSRFLVSRNYVFVDELCSLPAKMTCTLTLRTDKESFFPAFSKTRAEWGSPDADALTWALREDFTFRHNVFSLFDAGAISRQGRFRPSKNVPVQVSCLILPTAASYAINGTRYATVKYDAGIVPKQGYFGFATYAPVADCTVEDVSIHHVNLDPERALLAPRGDRFVHYPTPGFDVDYRTTWLDVEKHLPVTISANVRLSRASGAFIGCFSRKRAQWPSVDCDALTWTLAPYRTHHTFRTGTFRAVPNVTRLSKFEMPSEQTVNVVCSITSTGAEMSVDGKPVARAEFRDGDVPSNGYFGVMALSANMYLHVDSVTFPV